MFDMNTSTAFISAATGILSVIIFLPGIFFETFIADKELEALKKMAGDQQQTSDKQLIRLISIIKIIEDQFYFSRRISRVVQPAPATTTSGAKLDLGANDQVLRRRISRVAVQELHQEEELQHKGEQVSSTVDKLERGIRKYSTFISLDGSNVRMMDDPVLGQDL